MDRLPHHDSRTPSVPSTGTRPSSTVPNTRPFDGREVEQGFGGKHLSKIRGDIDQYQAELGVAKKSIAVRNVVSVRDDNKFNQDFVNDMKVKFETAYKAIGKHHVNKLPAHLQPLALAERNADAPNILISVMPGAIEADIKGFTHYIDPEFLFTHFTAFPASVRPFLIKNLEAIMASERTTPEQKWIAYEAFELYRKEGEVLQVEEAVMNRIIDAEQQPGDDTHMRRYTELYQTLPPQELKQLAPRIVERLQAHGIHTHEDMRPLMALKDVEMPPREPGVNVGGLSSKLSSLWSRMAKNGIIGLFMPASLRLKACQNALKKNPEDEKAREIVAHKMIAHLGEEMEYTKYLSGGEKSKAINKVATFLNQNLEALTPKLRSTVLEKVFVTFYEDTFKDLSGDDDPLFMNDWSDAEKKKFFELLPSALQDNQNLCDCLVKQLTRPETSTNAPIAWKGEVRKMCLEACGKNDTFRAALTKTCFEGTNERLRIYNSPGRVEAFKHLMVTTPPQEREALIQRLADEFVKVDLPADKRLSLAMGQDLGNACKDSPEVKEKLTLSIRAKLYGQGLPSNAIERKIQTMESAKWVTLVAFAPRTEEVAHESETGRPSASVASGEEIAESSFGTSEYMTGSGSSRIDRGRPGATDRFSSRSLDISGGGRSRSSTSTAQFPASGSSFSPQTASVGGIPQPTRMRGVLTGRTMQWDTLSESTRAQIESEREINNLDGLDAAMSRLNAALEKLRAAPTWDDYELALWYADSQLEYLKKTEYAEQRTLLLAQLKTLKQGLENSPDDISRSRLLGFCNAIIRQLNELNIDPSKMIQGINRHLSPTEIVRSGERKKKVPKKRAKRPLTPES